MKALYKGKRVTVKAIITAKNQYINKPILTQVKIEMNDGNRGTITDIVDANEIQFIEE